jgi:hypothetical protein
MTIIPPKVHFFDGKFAGLSFEKEIKGEVIQFELTVINQKNWQEFKEIRHEARHGEDRKNFIACDEDNWTDEDWKKRTEENEFQVIYGLRANGKLVGVVAAWKDAESDVAHWGNVYLRREYQGHKLMKLLYEARDIWTKLNPNYDHVKYEIREDNDRSLDIRLSEKREILGERLPPPVLIDKKSILWSDGNRANVLVFKQGLHASLS